jgi:hypothetical protein
LRRALHAVEAPRVVKLRLPYYLDKRLTDGGKVVSPTRRLQSQGFFFLRFLVLICVIG